MPPPEHYTPSIKDAKPLIEPKHLKLEPDATYRVVALKNGTDGAPILCMDNGLQVSLLGVYVPAERHEQACAYLTRYVVGKRVMLRFEQPPNGEGQPVPAYLYLTNRLFVNRKMIEMGLAQADRSQCYTYRKRFIEAEENRHVQAN